jgi:hypothetical protein
MNRHPGVSVALSFALVAFFAVILYQPEHIPLPHAGEEFAARESTPLPVLPPAPAPPLTPAEPLTVAPAPRPAIVPVAATTWPVPSADRGVEHADPERPRPAVGLPAQPGFTLAGEGETLRDVALRVYGSADHADALWRLNRDLVGQPDAILEAGALLRTP